MSVFQIVAVILGLTALFAYLNDCYLRLEQTIGLMVLALGLTILLGLASALGIFGGFAVFKAFVSNLSLDDTLLKGVLCFMLFAGSANVKIGTLREERWPILTLAIGATFLSAVLVGFGLWGGFALVGVSFGLIYAFVFGALISPTDPIAALAILGKVGLPPRLEAVIDGESLFNDGVGVVLFTIALTAALGASQPTLGDALVMFLREVLGGVALGVATGLVMHHTLLRTRDFGTQVLLTLSLIAIAYSIAERIEVSGPIAVVITGLLIGNITRSKMEKAALRPLDTFWRAVDESLNAVVFVLIGLHLALVDVVIGSVPIALYAIAVCLLARWLSVYLCLVGLAEIRELKADVPGLANLLTWGGLRGGLAIAMALSLPDSAEKSIILLMTFGVVAFSLIVQGLSIDKLFKAEKLSRLLR